MPVAMTDPDDMRKYANALRLESEARIQAITQELIDGDVSLMTWEENMKAELRRANLEQYVTGRGGDKSVIARTDYLKLGPELRRQYKYLHRFAKQLSASAQQDKPLDYALSRATLYARSTQAMFWKTAVPVDLPQVPRDGKTRCRTNCKCRIDYDYVRDDDGAITDVLVYWRLSPAEHCEDCLQLAREWNPLQLPVEGDIQESSLRQAVELLLLAEPELRPVSTSYMRCGIFTR